MGACLVCTSNRAPMDLYKNGVQRDLFVPFLRELERRCQVEGMWDSDTDYRLILGRDGAGGVYFIGNGDGRQHFEKLCLTLSKGTQMGPVSLNVHGRSVEVPAGCPEMGVAAATFLDLCGKPLGAADYIAIAGTFHTVLISDVPFLGLADVNHVRRFITLVDALYDADTKLVVHAAAEPDKLLTTGGDSAANFDEIFAFDRTVSRLVEMGGVEYLGRSAWAGRGARNS